MALSPIHKVEPTYMVQAGLDLLHDSAKVVSQCRTTRSIQQKQALRASPAGSTRSARTRTTRGRGSGHLVMPKESDLIICKAQLSIRNRSFWDPGQNLLVWLRRTHTDEISLIARGLNFRMLSTIMNLGDFCARSNRKLFWCVLANGNRTSVASLTLERDL
jgi:hypothetical protein